MTDGEPGMDPRYDPRFQRGYDASRDGDAPVPASAPKLAGPGGDAGGGVLGRDASGIGATGDAEPGSPPEASARARPAEVAGPSPDGAAPGPAAEREAATDVPHGSPTGPRQRSERELQADRRAAAARVHSWLIGGWAVTGGALLLGAWLAWIVNSDFSYYSGIVDQASENLRVLGWSLAPSLLLTGAVGAVVVTAAAANLHDDPHADPHADPEEHPRFRRAPAWWALLAIAVGAIVTIAWGVAAAAEGNRVGATLGFGPDGNISDDQQALLDTMALGQVAQMLIPALASAAIAALVAMVVTEALRAARGMPRRAGPDGR